RGAGTRARGARAPSALAPTRASNRAKAAWGSGSEERTARRIREDGSRARRRGRARLGLAPLRLPQDERHAEQAREEDARRRVVAELAVARLDRARQARELALGARVGRVERDRLV